MQLVFSATFSFPGVTSYQSSFVRILTQWQAKLFTQIWAGKNVRNAVTR
jgi:hypothetical protein